MGRIAKVLSFIRVNRNGANVSDVKVDPGGGANVTDEHYAPPGDDSYPLDSDYVATMDIDRTGGEVVVGYVDPLNTPKALKGDKRIYARDPNTGAVVVELWLGNDGSAALFNSLGNILLAANGNVNINGVIIDTSGNIVTTGTVNADDVTADNQDVTLSTHTHNTGSVPAPDPGS
jgi:hypothetical protein